MLRSKLLPPGWYNVYVKDLEQGAAGTDGSALYIFKLIVEGPAPDVKGVPLRFQVSEKALGMAIPLLTAVGWKAVAGTVELSDAVNKRVQCCVQRDEYRGKPQNVVVDFRPLPTPTS